MPESDVTNGELARLIQAQTITLGEIKTELKTQNGSVARHETQIEVLKERVANIKETDTTARLGAMGSFLAAISALIWQWIRH